MILRLGSKGERVRELQTLLSRHGFWPKGQAFTTNFGPVTEKNVLDFQKARGLKPDGLVGPMSWSRLAETVKNEIKPVYTVDAGEDYSDPEEEMLVDDIKESQPTCPNIYELIKLIDSASISRVVTRLVFHCTATHQNATVEAILRHWREKRGWKNPGYHIIVKPDGSWTQLQDFNRITNGVAGINSTSIHVSYIGGIDKNGKAFDNRTEKQREVFETIYRHFKNKMSDLTFHGHYEFSNKACPSYNVKNWIEELDVNI
jgi:N-acetylmuramoyl-L-alanine amidase